MIKYIPYKEIDIEKWDKCIYVSYNGIVYAYSWYLDKVCETWDALVEGDYEVVMPLPRKTLLGKPYIYIPTLVRQLGVFSTKLLVKNTIEAFLHSIPDNFIAFDINLNKFNNIGKIPYAIQQRKSFEIDLISPYRKIFQGYSILVKKNISKAYKNKLSIINGLLPEEFINLFRENNVNNVNMFSGNEYKALLQIISFCLQYKTGEIIAVYSRENNLCAAGLFVYANNKVIFLFSAVNKDGYKNKAIYYIIDHYINTHAEKNLTLSFENLALNRKSISYSGFGAKEYEYFNVRKKKYPWVLKFKNLFL